MLHKFSSLTYRLRPSIVLLFISLVVPLFASLVILTYFSNEKAANKTAQHLLERFNREVLSGLEHLIDPVGSLVRTTGTVASLSPQVMRADEGFAAMEAVLQHSGDIASVYMGFEDGSFRAVYRTPKGVRFQDQPSPEGAVLARRWLDRRPGPGPAVDVMVFLDAQRRVLETRQIPAAYDPRKRNWYQSASQDRQTILSGPYVFASNGRIGISLAQAVPGPGGLQGVIAADVTLSTLEDLLQSRRVSAASVSLILDADHRVVATSTPTGSPAIRKVHELPTPLPAMALGLMPREGRDPFLFTDPGSGQVYMAKVSDVQAQARTGWTVLTVAPLSDFLADIKANNERMAYLGLLAILLQLLVIYLLSRQLAQPLEKMAQRVAAIEQLQFRADEPAIESRFSEVRRLAHSIERMSKAIQAFAAFVPIELVRSLMKAEGKLELGGHSRFLTVMFCDLESFSTLSENSPSQELLLRVSKYLEIATEAIGEELGTVDKFIGDGVMAFWGAPTPLEDHAWRACVAAIKIQRRMDVQNQAWEAEGLPPLKVRIGIHSDAVLVGNIGSPQRMSYTVMGDGVNVAARLEGVNKDLGTQICVSKAVFREAGERIYLRPLEDVTVKGRKTPVGVYELLGVKHPEAGLGPRSAA